MGKVANVRQGTYLCACCFKPSKLNAGEAPLLGVEFRAKHGCYVGKKENPVGHHIAYAIRLMEGGRCQLDCTTSTPSSGCEWRAVGTYIEELTEHGELKAVKFTPDAEGRRYEFTVEKGASNENLICEGIACPFQIGVPDYEIAQMMKAP